MDCESERVVAQVKHVQRPSLARLEALTLEMVALGEEQGKIGVVVVKRRAGRGKGDPRACRAHGGCLEQAGRDPGC